MEQGKEILLSLFLLDYWVACLRRGPRRPYCISMSSGFMPYEWEGNSGNSVFLVFVYQREMGRRKFFAFSVVKQIQPTGRRPSRFYAKDVIDFFVLGLSNIPYSRNLHVFLFYGYDSPYEVCIYSVVCFIPFLVSPSTFITLFSGIEINLTCQNHVITRGLHHVKEISQLNIYRRNKYGIFYNLEEDFLF